MCARCLHHNFSHAAPCEFLPGGVSNCEVQLRGCLLLADTCAGVDTDSAVQQRREQVMKAALELSLGVAPSR